MTLIEDRIRNVMVHQAEAMQVPDARPAEQMARVVDLSTAPRRGRALMISAAAVLVVGGIVALSQRRDEPTVAGDAVGADLFRFETPTVLLEAASVEVDAAGQTFVPGGDLKVEGDPGMPNEYTTLELTWHEHGVEQRINIYFTSDGTNWWADEIRTYNGATDGDWIEQHGEFFKTPVGGAYVGDLDLANLKIHSMRLEAFRRPAACANPDGGPLALIADFPEINAPVGGYGATLEVFDTTTCQPMPVSAFTFAYASDDPTVAELASDQLSIPDYPETKNRIDLDLVTPGETTIHVVAKDHDGAVVGSAAMHVVVQPADDSVVAGTAPPLDTAVPVPANP